MNVLERAVPFFCEGDQLAGITSSSHPAGPVGVVVVVGGPQYRIGSHRQFTLLSRSLAASGITTFRFDYRGMGDAEGEIRAFDTVDADIRAAIDAFLADSPHVKQVVLWGLCDGASASLMYAARDERVCGLVMLNPWVRNEQSQAVAQIKHYYARRLFSRDLWRKVFGGRFQLRRFLSDARSTVSAAVASGEANAAGACFQDRMLTAWQGFSGPSLVMLSGRDLTAKEFLEYAAARPAWQRRLEGPRVARQDFPDADHTFSTRTARDAVAQCTAQWIVREFLATAPSTSRAA